MYMYINLYLSSSISCVADSTCMDHSPSSSVSFSQFSYRDVKLCIFSVSSVSNWFLGFTELINQTFLHLVCNGYIYSYMHCKKKQKIQSQTKHSLPQPPPPLQYLEYNRAWFQQISEKKLYLNLDFRWRAMVFNATFKNISVPRENHRPVASHWHTFSHNVAPRILHRVNLGISRIRTHNVSFSISNIRYVLVLWIIKKQGLCLLQVPEVNMTDRKYRST